MNNEINQSQYIADNNLNEILSKIDPDAYSLIKLLSVEIRQDLYINLKNGYLRIKNEIFKKGGIEKELQILPNEMVYKILEEIVLEVIEKNKNFLMGELYIKTLGIQKNNTDEKEELEKYKRIAKKFFQQIVLNKIEIFLLKFFQQEGFIVDQIVRLIETSKIKIQNLDIVLCELFKVLKAKRFNLDVIQDLINGSEKKIQNLDIVLYELFKTYVTIHPKHIQILIEGSDNKIQNIENILLKFFETGWIQSDIIKALIDGSEKKIQNLDMILCPIIELGYFHENVIKALINGSEKKIENLEGLLSKLVEAGEKLCLEKRPKGDYSYPPLAVNLRQIQPLIDGSERKIQNLDILLLKLFKINRFTADDIKALINGSEKKIENLDGLLSELFKKNYPSLKKIQALIEGSECKILHDEKVYNTLEKKYPEVVTKVSLCKDLVFHTAHCINTNQAMELSNLN